MSRTVTLFLVDAGGTPLGALPPYDVPAPWWQEVADVVAGARRTHAVDVTVLRLLRTERPVPHGGAVDYLAELVPVDGSGAGPEQPGTGPGRTPTTGRAALPLAPIDRATLDAIRAAHPLRSAWAVPGGPTRSLRWAAGELARLGRGPVTGSQQRAWNLSTIWRLDPTTGPTGNPHPTSDPHPTSGLRSDPAAGRNSTGTPVWLKQVPAFFRHEPTVLRWLQERVPGLTPTLLAADDDGRMLLDHVPGEDWYGVDPAGRDAIAADQHRIQLAALPYAQTLVRRGVPDLRGVSLARTVTDALTASGADLGPVAPLLRDLDARLAAIAGCGVPDTLVHGDLHPGNVRFDGQRRVLIDWGDSFVGHPGFDILRLTERLDPGKSDELVASWARRWRESRPGAEPERALDLLRPVAALRAAAVYADFVARIEPSEQPFHRADVPHHLADAARQVARSGR